MMAKLLAAAAAAAAAAQQNSSTSSINYTNKAVNISSIGNTHQEWQ